MSERARKYAAKYSDYVYMIRLKALRSKMIARFNVHFSGLDNLDEYIAFLIEEFGIDYGRGRVLADKMRRFFSVSVGTLEASKEKLKERFADEGFNPLWLDMIEQSFSTHQNFESVMNIDL